MFVDIIDHNYFVEEVESDIREVGRGMRLCTQTGGDGI